MSAQHIPLDAYWMPFTGNRQFKRHPRMIRRATGLYFEDNAGRRIFDGMSGLWCCGLGHSRSEIAHAVRRQLGELDYAPAFQFGHPNAFELADRLARLAPPRLDHVFFCSSGSEAADTALKVARAYWRYKGRPEKTRLIGRQKGYHGVNFGGLSVGGIGPNRKLFGALVESDHLPHTLLQANRFARGMPEQGGETLADALLDLIALHDASNIAAVIVEPFSGSAGVVVPPIGYLQRLREICTQHQILLIFDEVITAFGRTGAMFGAETFGVVPDMLTFAKQITNGAIPLGGVIASGEIYNIVVDNDAAEHLVELPHGYTYSGHPVACAAAVATLDLIEREGVAAQVSSSARHLEEAVHSLRDAPHVLDIRNFGLAAGLTIEPREDPTRRPFEVAMKCWEAGIYVRYAGDTIQIAPPFVSTDQQIDQLVDVLRLALTQVG